MKPAGDEDALMQAVKKYGPIAVDIQVNHKLRAYAGGVFDEACDGARNHAVIIVG